MTLQASDIIARARIQLIDSGTVARWNDAEMLLWLSDGQRSIVALAPSASAATATLALIAGTKQTIPADGHMLLTITRNLSGSTSGRACRVISREVLDAYSSNWHAATAEAAVKNYIYEPTLPRNFYVYPPNDGTGSVEISYSVLPVELTSVDDEIGVDPVYQTALLDYLMYRCYQKDADFAAGQALAATYLQAFMAFVMAGEGSQGAANPNLQLVPSDPSSKATAK